MGDIPSKEKIICDFCDKARGSMITFVPRGNRIDKFTICSVPVVEYYHGTDI